MSCCEIYIVPQSILPHFLWSVCPSGMLLTLITRFFLLPSLFTFSFNVPSHSTLSSLCLNTLVKDFFHIYKLCSCLKHCFQIALLHALCPINKVSQELDYLELRSPSIPSKWIMKARSSYLVRQLDLLDYVTMQSYKSILPGFKLALVAKPQELSQSVSNEELLPVVDWCRCDNQQRLKQQWWLLKRGTCCYFEHLYFLLKPPTTPLWRHIL